MKTGKIKSVDRQGQWNNLDKFKVTFADGNQYTFFAKGNFKAEVGDEIKFEVTNEEYGNAKLIRENDRPPYQQGGQQRNPSNGNKDILIIRQTCIKASAELNAKDGNIDRVLEDAQIMFNWITE